MKYLIKRGVFHFSFEIIQFFCKPFCIFAIEIDFIIISLFFVPRTKIERSKLVQLFNRKAKFCNILFVILPYVLHRTMKIETYSVSF